MGKHLIVVSIDAMVFEDIEYCKALPNFSKILDGAAVIERVRTIYPSLTHPVHATLLTGNTAGVTGAINNSLFNADEPDSPIDVWYNNLDQINCDTLLHAAKRAGLTVATASWPMTSYGNNVIDYLVPCALDADFIGYEDDPMAAYKALGAEECVMPIIEDAVKLFGYENRHPEVDAFQIYCTTEIIKRFKPNLVMTHPGYVDNQRHETGVFGSGVTPSLEKTDRWLGMLLDAIRDAGIEGDTDIVLLSDHGQINITRTVSPNVYLKDKGYVSTDSDGRITSWRAYVQSAGASAHVYLDDPADKKLYEQIYSLLTAMANEGTYGFERVYTTDEVKEKYGLCGGFSFVLETDGETSFGEWCAPPAVRTHNITDYRLGKGTHGHEPHKGPQPTFIANGPSFKKGVTLRDGSILNHAPTLAAVLGTKIEGTAGKAVDEILDL